MSDCRRARDMFGAYWDDETTRAERDWLDAHFAACAACRAEYELLTRTLTTVAALPRVEAAPDLAERSLAAARKAPRAPDRIFVTATPAWVPAAAAAALLLVAGVALAPRFLQLRDAGSIAALSTPVAEPRLVALTGPAGGAATRHGAGPASHPAPVAISETLFDHTEDVDFVLEPVTMNRGRARAASKLPQGIRRDRAIISF